MKTYAPHHHDTICTKKGVRKFKKRGKVSATKKLTKMHMLETFAPVDAIKLTKKQRAEVVESLLSQKENRNGDIKEHAFDYDIKQR